MAFLNCGTALKPIMPKGQCWSITDTNSKFVLQIRRPNYWRIELPVSTQDELDKAQALRTVFDKVLQFEKTPCPFERPFTVPLPDKPIEPVKKKVWAPVQNSSSIDYSKAVEVAAVPVKVLDNKPRRGSRLSLRTDREMSRELNPESASKQDPVSNCMDNEAAPGSPRVKPAHTTLNPSSVERKLTSPGPNPALGDEEVCAAPQEEHAVKRESPKLPSSPRSMSGGPQAASLQPLSLSSPNFERVDVLAQEPENLIPDNHSGDVMATLQQSTVEDEPRPDAIEGSGTQTSSMKAKLRRRHTGFGSLRSAPSAPQLTLIASPPSKQAQRGPVEPDETTSDNAGRASPACSQDSFHSTQSWLSPITPLPPSPPGSHQGNNPDTFPYPHDHIAFPAGQDERIELPSTPITPRSDSGSLCVAGSEDRTPTQPRIPQPRLSGDANPYTFHDEAGRSSQSLAQRVDLRVVEGKHSTAFDRTVVRRRALSPLPPAATIFQSSNERAPYRPSALSMGGIPMMLIAKTCGILLRPPTFLITLMLKIAARITAGEWRGTAVGYDPDGDHIPVDWDYSDSEWEDEWEAGYEQSMGGQQPSQCTTSRRDQAKPGEESFEDANQSWEVD